MDKRKEKKRKGKEDIMNKRIKYSEGGIFSIPGIFILRKYIGLDFELKVLPINKFPDSGKAFVIFDVEKDDKVIARVWAVFSEGHPLENIFSFNRMVAYLSHKCPVGVETFRDVRDSLITASVNVVLGNDNKGMNNPYKFVSKGVSLIMDDINERHFKGRFMDEDPVYWIKGSEFVHDKSLDSMDGMVIVYTSPSDVMLEYCELISDGLYWFKHDMYEARLNLAFKITGIVITKPAILRRLIGVKKPHKEGRTIFYGIESLKLIRGEKEIDPDSKWIGFPVAGEKLNMRNSCTIARQLIEFLGSDVLRKKISEHVWKLRGGSLYGKSFKLRKFGFSSKAICSPPFIAKKYGFNNEMGGDKVIYVDKRFIKWLGLPRDINGILDDYRGFAIRYPFSAGEVPITRIVIGNFFGTVWFSPAVLKSLGGDFDGDGVSFFVMKASDEDVEFYLNEREKKKEIASKANVYRLADKMWMKDAIFDHSIDGYGKLHPIVQNLISEIGFEPNDGGFNNLINILVKMFDLTRNLPDWDKSERDEKLTRFKKKLIYLAYNKPNELVNIFLEMTRRTGNAVGIYYVAAQRILMKTTKSYESSVWMIELFKLIESGIKIQKKPLNMDRVKFINLLSYGLDRRWDKRHPDIADAFDLLIKCASGFRKKLEKSGVHAPELFVWEDMIEKWSRKTVDSIMSSWTHIYKGNEVDINIGSHQLRGLIRILEAMSLMLLGIGVGENVINGTDPHERIRVLLNDEERVKISEYLRKKYISACSEDVKEKLHMMGMIMKSSVDEIIHYLALLYYGDVIAMTVSNDGGKGLLSFYNRKDGIKSWISSIPGFTVIAKVLLMNELKIDAKGIDKFNIEHHLNIHRTEVRLWNIVGRKTYSNPILMYTVDNIEGIVEEALNGYINIDTLVYRLAGYPLKVPLIEAK